MFARISLNKKCLSLWQKNTIQTNMQQIRTNCNNGDNDFHSKRLNGKVAIITASTDG